MSFMSDLLSPRSVERHVTELIERFGLQEKMSLKEVKQRIYESDGDDSMQANNLYTKWWLQMLPRGAWEKLSTKEMNAILQTMADAWNVFPHRALDGKSPQEKMIELYGENAFSKNVKEEKVMPRVTVGGQEVSWEEHQAMLKRMEKAQKPFRKWVEKTAMPAFEEYLAHRYKSGRTREKYRSVADVFLQRVLYVGFRDYEEIRPEFVVWEFPEWWPSHVFDSNLDPDQVWSALCEFLWFAEFALQRSIPRVWEVAGEEE